jgi:hypothetical protein
MKKPPNKAASLISNEHLILGAPRDICGLRFAVSPTKPL